MQEMQSGFQAGAVVRLRGEPWRITLAEPYERCMLLTLRGVGGGNLGSDLRVLTPFDRPRMRAVAGRPRIVNRCAALRRAVRAAAEAHPWHGLWTASSASIELLPWQLEPALAIIEGATRILLADGVGLGKTIQAGLILSELLARGLVDRALLLTPPGLRRQWRGELATRFRIDATEFDYDTLARKAMELPSGANPWTTAAVVISSLDLVKRPEHLAALDAVPFGLLLVDEAHHVTPGTDRGAVVSRLARSSAFVVLITATPHSGDERAFAFLSAVGRAADPLVAFRRTAEELELRSSRRIRTRAIQPTSDERAMLDAVAAYGRAIWRARGRTDESARLVATILGRRAASSAFALHRTLERRLLLLSRVKAGSLQPELPWTENEERDASDPDVIVGAPGLDDPNAERDELTRLMALAMAAMASPSKVQWLERLLARAREPVVIFSEYRDTIEDLRDRLRRHDVDALHGGLPPAMRRAVVDRFTSGLTRVLLATDAAGEGLNLQARCRAVINVELPWNPVRLEQRIGRVDRLGQSRPVHATNLLHAGSIEERVLARLLQRMREATRAGPLAANALGSAVVHAVAEDAFRGGSLTPLTELRVSTTRIVRADSECQRLAVCRRLSVLGRSGEPRATDLAPSVATMRRGYARGILCLFELVGVDGLGRLTGREIIPVAVRLHAPCFLKRRTARDLIRSLDTHENLQATLRALAEDRIDMVRAQAAQTAEAYGIRWAAVCQNARSNAPPLFQTSLFDARAARLAAERTAVRNARLELLERRCAVARQLAEVTLAGPARLIAAWPIDIHALDGAPRPAPARPPTSTSAM